VNPYDTEDLAQAIHRALEMTPDEKKARMSRMRAYVREHNIYRWAGTLIAELTSLRTREVPPRPKIAPIGEFKTGGRKLA
jgi:trehalose 6-phosphate synthase